MEEPSFYEDIDEVLGPPPARLYRYGSGVLLIALLILGGVAAGVNYREGIPATAFISGAPGTHSLKLALAAGAYPPPPGRIPPVFTGRQIPVDLNASAGRPAWHSVAVIQSEPYLDSAVRQWVLDAVFADTTGAAAITGRTHAKGLQTAVFIVTGSRSLLSRLFRF